MTENTVTIPVIAVYGTGAGDYDLSDDECVDPGHWWHQHSPWWHYMEALGFCPFRTDDFVWASAIDGLSSYVEKAWNFVRRRPQPPPHRLWYAGGQALDDYIGDGIYRGRDAARFLVVAHSHGGQVALYAAASGRKIPILITVSTPHRRDMQIVTEKAKGNIGYWVHLFDPDHDRVGQAGAFGDGGVSFDRRQPRADVNVPLKGCSHSLALSDAAHYAVWKDLVLPVIADLLAGWRV